MAAEDPSLNLPTGPADAHAKAAANGQELHDPKGRFTPGNPGAPKGPGRPKGRPNFWTELRVAIRKYRAPDGRKFFDTLIDHAIVVPRLAEKILDKLFEDATVPKGIDLTMIQGAGQIENVVKDLAAARRARLEAAGLKPVDEPEEP